FQNIDRAIEIVRRAESRPQAQTQLMKEFDLDEVQADAILETRLYQLAKLEIAKIREEQRQKKERAGEIEALLESNHARWKIVRSELEAIGAKFGDKRRTILNAGAELVYDAESYVVHESTTVVVTRDGWFKRLGEIKDPSSTRVREGDFAKWILRGSTRDNLALFTNFGVLYVLKALDVPATTGYGEPVQSRLNFGDGERIISAALIAPPPAEEEAASLPRRLVVTTRGMGFFCRPELSETTKNGRRVARVRDGDEVLVFGPGEGDTVTTATSDGKVLSFPADELPELSGAGQGVILMRIDKDDKVIGSICHPVDETPIAIDEEGNERRFHAPEQAHRAQTGRKVLKRFKAVELQARNADSNS
ncbi:MAG TPA: DNA gyrase C-terminal beta-propeller domain-containing protein, partial [Terriglobales bacterium]|nr:DNA gyrase C-terminal beta-propeller domain-containing protein [Terriglobales bacterium]